MLQHQRQKLQGGNLRMRQNLLIGPIKRLFNTLWRHAEATLWIESVKAREPMHATRIQGATEVEQQRVNSSEVHAQSLSSPCTHQRLAPCQRSANRRPGRRDWGGERRDRLHLRAQV